MADRENVDTNTGEITSDMVELASPSELRKAFGQSVRVDDETMRGIQTFEDAMALSTELHGDVESIADVMGSGFVVTDKDELVGREMILLNWHFSAGDYGRPFASVAAVLKDGAKVIFNDGGTGICTALMDFTRSRGRWGGVHVPHGLRASEYATCPECNRPRSEYDVICTNVLSNGSECGDTSEKRLRGATYYLDTSPA